MMASLTLTARLLMLAGPAAADGFLTQLEEEFVHLVAGVRPSLITVLGAGRHEATVGSGLALSEDGLVLTAGSNADLSDHLAVELPDGRRVSSMVLGEDHRSGLALLRADGARLTAARLGDAEKLRPGSMVLVLWRQFGPLPSISPGVVWGLAPRAGIGDPMIQISAAAPAPAGGAVVGSRGEVVGVVVGTDAESEPVAAGSMLYAVPAARAVEIAERIASEDSSGPGYLGVNIQELTPRLQKLFDLPAAKGVLIAQVVESGPADQAGLRRGDVIVRIDRAPVASTEDLLRELESRRVGQAVELEVLRDGESQRYMVTLGERPRGQRLRSFRHGPRVLEFGAGGGSLGIQPQPLTDQLRAHFGVPEGRGVLVAAVLPGSPAEQAGLKAGDVLLQVGDQGVSAPHDLVGLPGRFRSGDKVSVTVVRDAREQQIEVTFKEFEAEEFEAPHGDFLWSWPHWEAPELGEELRDRLRSWGPELRRKLKEELGPQLEQEREHLRQELDDLRRELDQLKRELKEKLEDRPPA